MLKTFKIPIGWKDLFKRTMTEFCLEVAVPEQAFQGHSKEPR